MRLRTEVIGILAALAATTHAIQAVAKVDVEESTFSTNPYTGEVVECNETGCQVVHNSITSGGRPPANGDVAVCTDEGCYRTHESQIDPTKFTQVCQDGQCHLEPIVVDSNEADD